MHALIIEQEAMIALMIEDALREIGFTSFDFVCTVADAVAAAERRCPDLITSDVQIGVGSGIEAVRTICSQKPIPVIFITATAREVHDQLLNTVVVQKPFRMADLKPAFAAATGVYLDLA